MLKSKGMLVVAPVLIVLAVSILVLRLRDPSSALSMELPEFVGLQLALQVEPLLAEDQSVVLVVPDLPGAEDPYVVANRRGFIDGLAERVPGARVVEVGVSADPMRLQAGKPFFQSAELTRLIGEHPQCKVFVSLAGIPDFSRSQLRNWNDANPKFVVFAPLGGAAQQLVESGALYAAIVPKGQDPAWEDDAEDSSLQARFDQDYQILSR